LSADQSPIYLSNAEVADLASFADAVDVLDELFRGIADGRSKNSPRQRLAARSATLHVMAGLSGEEFFGVKTYTTSQRGAPMVVLLFGADGSGLKAVVEGAALSALRTGAASGLSARYMAPQSTGSIGLIGAGGQAAAQIQGVVAAIGPRPIRVYARDPARRSQFSDFLRHNLGLDAAAVDSPQSAAEDAGVVVTITSAATPVLTVSDIGPATHVIAAGNNQPDRAEVDAELVARCAVVAVDHLLQARSESGDLILAESQGAISWDNVVDLADVVAGTAEGRHSEMDITLFESQGIGAEDVAMAATLFRLARAKGRGRQLVPSTKAGL
jgi:ornithine cyclodeaminase/alanine dehydrogenase-like protein (mu-crystallin family)